MEGQQQYRRWDSNSSHGQLLLSLIINKQITERMPTQTVQELYPQFRVYPTTNFSTILSRFRKKVASGDYVPPNNNNNNNILTTTGQMTPVEFSSHFHDNIRK